MSFKKTQIARMLRKRSTKSEDFVWEAVRNRKLWGFILDFFCPEIRLAIEVDGPIHERQKLYDTERQRVIEQDGVYFVRVTNQEVALNMDILKARIKSHLDKKKLHFF